MTYAYLHGFASSPKSKKANVFRLRSTALGVDLQIPDLNAGGLESLTITRQLSIINDCVGSDPACLIGSSLGGYLAALYAARHPEVRKLVLLAPAFGFARLYAESLGEEAVRRWEAEGSLTITDYSTGLPVPLGWQMMEDARKYEEEPAITQPCLILHGREDGVVPVTASRAFARTRTSCELIELESDHELMDVVDEVWELSRRYLLE